MKSKTRRVAIVTGGASGIGRAVCLKLYKEGHPVVVCDKNLEAAQTLVRERSRAGVEMLPRYHDVTRPKQVKALFEEVFQRYGRIDILVNSAGITTSATRLTGLSDSNFKKVIDVHVMGTFYCMKQAAPYMIKGNFGRIINISSRAGIFGLYGKSNYSAAKAGMIGLSLTAAKELFEQRITVNVIAPGGIRTPFSSPILAGINEQPSRLDLVVGEPEDVAHLVYFLTMEESYLVNGAVILLDAGGSLWHGMDDKLLSLSKKSGKKS
jgi:3-oxoacyl-[acyl-carrier protein] reductase